ncbi:MAG: superoxide dismutase, Ni [Crocinitomicaceae bacterium]|nr:superoxide dismutase, Ni [Crocinitomicaceae bacterium]
MKFSYSFILILSLLVGSKAFSHCQIPCGIYEDSMRIETINEHIMTIEKSMNKINELSEEGDKNYNQIVRWVMNKEEHATAIQTIVNEYFIIQRVKPVDPENDHLYEHYTEHLVNLHHISFYAMKCKQTTDLENVAKLKEAVMTFSAGYFHTH